MGYRLTGFVQVRKESWGLLFYSQNQHRIFFVKSSGWLEPHHFDGNWDFERLASDIASRTGTAADKVERTLQKLTDNLVKNGMVVHELR
jgi:putative mycofactocin binding protein MftB